MYRRLALLIVGVMLTSACSDKASHPPSPFRSTLRLLSEIVVLRTNCLARSDLRCGLDQLDSERLQRWGPLSEVGAQSAVFGDYRIEVTVQANREFCVSAVPVGADSSLDSIWKTPRGEIKVYAPPWKERPPECHSRLP
jgi:hypothetical protein